MARGQTTHIGVPKNSSLSKITCLITAAGIRRAIDGYEGARLVVRHNQFHNSGVSGHGTEGQGRGAKQVEEY